MIVNTLELVNKTFLLPEYSDFIIFRETLCTVVPENKEGDYAIKDLTNKKTGKYILWENSEINIDRFITKEEHPEYFL